MSKGGGRNGERAGQLAEQSVGMVTQVLAENSVFLQDVLPIGLEIQSRRTAN